MAATRSILHLAMDPFFASIEQLDNPASSGRPVLVGHDGPRGVVAAASYEARVFGCHSAMPMAIARRRCPQAVIVPGRRSRYREVSARMFAILDAFSPLVEPLSVDEAFIDVTGTERLFGSPRRLAQRIKDRIRAELGLIASVGVAPNKFLAKLASDLEKPDGLTVITQDNLDATLLPLPVTKIWGVGPATAAKLESIGVRTIAQLRAVPAHRLSDHLGDDAQRFARLAHGIDDRPVVSDHEAKSIGHEQTFEVDIAQPGEVRRVLLDQAEQVARRLRKHGLSARCVTLKIRYGDFETISRSITLDIATNTTAEVCRAAALVFERWAAGSFQPVRLIGVTADRLGRGAGQPDLFSQAEREKQQRADAAADRIVEKFGKRAIRRGGALE